MVGDPSRRWSSRISIESRQVSTDARRVSIDSRRFSHQPDPRRLSASYALRAMANQPLNSPFYANQYNVSLTPAPVDLDVEEAMEPKPRGFRRESSISMPTPVHLHDGHSPGEKSPGLVPEDSELTLQEEKDLAYFVGTLDEDEDPKNFSFLRKCLIVFVVSSGALCSTCASSMVRKWPEPSPTLSRKSLIRFRCVGILRRARNRALASRTKGSLHSWCINIRYRFGYVKLLFGIVNFITHPGFE